MQSRGLGTTCMAVGKGMCTLIAMSCINLCTTAMLSTSYLSRHPLCPCGRHILCNMCRLQGARRWKSWAICRQAR